MEMEQYRFQKCANIGALIHDADFEERLEVLLKLESEFAKNEVEWAWCCSGALFLNGIVDNFHDIDMLGSPHNIQTTEKVLRSLGEKAPKDEKKAKFFESAAYSTYHVGRVDVEHISEFGVITFGTFYQYHFNKDELEYVDLEIDDKTVTIPIAPIESQYLIYYMMEGWQKNRRLKREQIDTYLKTPGGLRHPEILQNALKEDIPYWIKADIKKILKANKKA